MPASVPSLMPSISNAEAATLGPSAVHPQQDLAPVLRVDAAVFGVDLHDAVGLVVLAGEQAAQVELVELFGDRRDRRVELGLLRLVVDLAGHLVQHLGIFEFAAEARRTGRCRS